MYKVITKLDLIDKIGVCSLSRKNFFGIIEYFDFDENLEQINNFISSFKHLRKDCNDLKKPLPSVLLKEAIHYTWNIFSAARLSSPQQYEPLRKNSNAADEAYLKSKKLFKTDMPEFLNCIIDLALDEISENYSYHEQAIDCESAKKYLLLLKQNQFLDDYINLHLIAGHFDNYLRSTLKVEELTPRIKEIEPGREEQYYSRYTKEKEKKHAPYRKVYYDNITYFHALGIKEVVMDEIISLIYFSRHYLYEIRNSNMKMDLLGGIIFNHYVFKTLPVFSIILFLLKIYIDVHPEHKMNNESNSLKTLLNMLLQKYQKENKEYSKMFKYLEFFANTILDDNSKNLYLDNVYDVIEIIQFSDINYHLEERTLSFIRNFKPKTTIPRLNSLSIEEICELSNNMHTNASDNDWTVDRKEILGNYDFDYFLEYMYTREFPEEFSILQLYYHYFSFVGYKRDIEKNSPVFMKIQQTVNKMLESKLMIFSGVIALLIVNSKDDIAEYLYPILERMLKKNNTSSLSFIAILLSQCTDERHEDFKKDVFNRALREKKESGASAFKVKFKPNELEKPEEINYYVSPKQEHSKWWYSVFCDDCRSIVCCDPNVDTHISTRENYPKEHSTTNVYPISSDELFEALYQKVQEKHSNKHGHMVKLMIFLEMMGLSTELVKYLNQKKSKVVNLFDASSDF
ncbi:MAG: hypothetical protein HRT87_01640 [Legionellales bacterium]|nr:hypothetical protein [Legionellales bacterium]